MYSFIITFTKRRRTDMQRQYADWAHTRRLWGWIAVDITIVPHLCNYHGK